MGTKKEIGDKFLGTKGISQSGSWICNTIEIDNIECLDKG